ncbi:proprotein convertase subtilisin/kexin type 5-like isoform X3 [Saccostrea cucullata]|uniref:proprotein convertase subtilisin/kexin type 5-like isoform X3 n=1 Tax=Saccostrea cuccullata TaxID=36930 RepID=UPI002ED3BDBA
MQNVIKYLVYLFYISTYFLPSTQEQDVRCLPTEVIVRVGNNWNWHYTCKRACPPNQYVYRKHCYNICPSHTIAKDNGFIKFCVSDLEHFHCPRSICQKEYPYCFDGNCLDSCPEYTVGFNSSCVMSCPSEAKYITAFSCEGVCYSGNKSCSSKCPFSHPFQFRSTHLYHCLKECPSFTIQNSSKCELSCPSDRPFLYNKTCQATCPSSSPFTSLRTTEFNKIFICSQSCHEMMASYKNVCVSICPSRSPLEYRGKCVAYCQKDRPFTNTKPEKKASIFYQQCVAKCPSDKFLWIKNKECVTDCPDNTLLFNNTCVEVCPQTFPLNYTKLEHGKHEHICVKRCPRNTYRYNSFCFDQCPSYLKYFHSNCTSECPKTYPYTILDNATCVQLCPDPYVYDGKMCDKKCPKDHVYIENQQCVSVCSNTSALQRRTKQGIVCLNSSTCPNDTVLMENTTHCIGKCPKSMIMINDICTNRTSCPNSTYVENSTLGTMCTKKCSSNLYLDGNQCVHTCPFSKVIVEHNCSNDCPTSKPYRFVNTSHYDNPVTVCVSVCPRDYVIYQKKCILDDDCSFYLYEGRCYEVCPKNTAPDPTYISPMACMSQQSKPSLPLGVISFVLAVLFLIGACIYCCYKGRDKRQKSSSQRNWDDSQNLIEDAEPRPI